MDDIEFDITDDDSDCDAVDVDASDIVDERALRAQPPLRLITPFPQRASFNVFASLAHSVGRSRSGPGFQPAGAM